MQHTLANRKKNTDIPPIVLTAVINVCMCSIPGTQFTAGEMHMGKCWDERLSTVTTLNPDVAWLFSKELTIPKRKKIKSYYIFRKLIIIKNIKMPKQQWNIIHKWTGVCRHMHNINDCDMLTEGKVT